MKPNWEERASRLAVPASFSARVTPHDLLQVQLDYDEWVRLNKKMRLVEGSAVKLAMGMLKGTLKYESDVITQAAWMAHLTAEMHDAVNYLALMEGL